jgi:hypothetical protein
MGAKYVLKNVAITLETKLLHSRKNIQPAFA